MAPAEDLLSGSPIQTWQLVVRCTSSASISCKVSSIFPITSGGRLLHLGMLPGCACPPAEPDGVLHPPCSPTHKPGCAFVLSNAILSSLQNPSAVPTFSCTNAFFLQEMASAFYTRGAMPPPWRQTKAMLSKWLPSKSRDLLLAANIPTSPTSSEGASSFRDSASYLFDSSSPISTLAPWKNTSSPASSLPALHSRSEYPRQTPSRASSDSVRLKSALSSGLAAMNSAKGRQHATSNHAAKPDPVQHLSQLPGMERIFTVKMRGW